MGKRPDFEYHVGKWLKYDRSGYNSSHPSLGSPLDLGNPWRPLATLGGPWRPCLKMTIWGEIGHFQACRQGSPRSKGDPRVGWEKNAWPHDKVLIQSSILSHFDNSGKLNLKMDFQIFPFLLSTRWQSIIRRDVILGIGFGKEMQKIISH